MAADRMFHVLVLGGIGLVGAACAGTVETRGTGGAGGFPAEGPPIQETDAGPDGFPSETAVMIADAGADAFPSEGPQMLDAGFPDETDVSSGDGGPADGGDDSGFPQEAPPP